MTEQQMKLPDGWEWKVMSDISDVVGGGTPKSKQPEYYENGSIDWLTPADLSGYSAKFISSGARKITREGLSKSSAKLLPKGTVLFSSRAPIGYVAIAEKELSTNQGFKSFVLNDLKVESDYVYWWLKSAKHLAESMASGTTFLELSGAKAKQLPIPIAPPEQQKQIVAKIEELFSHIDAGIESLEIAKQKLKQYRQSVLKAAVTGELTKEWREANSSKTEPADQLLQRILAERRQRWEQQQLEQFQAKGKPPKNDKWKEKYKEPKSIEKDVDIDIPEQWCFVTMDGVAEIFLGKMLDKSKHTDGKKLGYLRNINVRWGNVDVSDISEMFFKESELERYKVVKGDVLVCEGGEPGRASVWNKDNYTFYQKALHRVRFFSEGFCSDYLVLYLEFLAKTYRLEKFFTGTTIKHFTKESFLSLPIPIPSNAEINKILEIVDEKLTAADRLMQELDTKLTQAQQQKQAILASVFKGRLIA